MCSANGQFTLGEIGTKLQDEMCSSCIESPKEHIPGKIEVVKLPVNAQIFLFIAPNHKEEVKDSKEDVHCVEDSIGANTVLQLIDGDEGSALEEKVEDDGGIEQGLLGEGQQVPAPPIMWQI